MDSSTRREQAARAAHDRAVEQASAQALIEERESESRFRRYRTGPWSAAVTALSVLFALFEIGMALVPALGAVPLRAWHVLFLLALAFLLYPACRSERRDRSRPTLFDGLCLAAGGSAFLYLIFNHAGISLRGGGLLPLDTLAASVGVIACFEMARRVALRLTVVALVFFLCNFAGAWAPGAITHPGFDWARVVDQLFWSDQGLLGPAAGVSATAVFLFVLFGAFLKYCGFSTFIQDLSLALTGRGAGGAAKAPVISNALTGMLNGSAIMSVASTGAVTIPLMRRCGCRPEFAAAVEAVASAGAQFAPPLMGAAGFLMAALVGVSYADVAMAALLPAALFFIALFMAVHASAKRLGLRPLSAGRVPRAGKILRERLHLLLPIVSLICLLAEGRTAQFAAAVSIAVAVVATWLPVAGAWLRKKGLEPAGYAIPALSAVGLWGSGLLDGGSALILALCLPVSSRCSVQQRMLPRLVIRALMEGTRSAVGVGVACVILGVILGTVSLTGLDLSVGTEARHAVPGQPLPGGLVAMLLGILLGMIMPGIAVYAIMASVAVPVLTGAGVLPMTAHLFCLFYAGLAGFLPPAGMTARVAAGIARADQPRTDILSLRIGLIGFVIPFFFLNNPLLLFSPVHPLAATLGGFALACLGVVALVAGIEGWLFAACGPVSRILLAAVGGLALLPGPLTTPAAVILFAGIAFLNRSRAGSA